MDVKTPEAATEVEAVLGGGYIDIAIYICPKCCQYMLKKFHSFCNVSTNRLTKATVAPSCESCLSDPKECRHKHFTATIEKKIPYCGFWLSKTYNPFKEVENIPGKTKDKWVISDNVIDHAAELRRGGMMWAEIAAEVNEKFTVKLFPAQINSAVIRKYPELRQRHYKTKKDDPTEMTRETDPEVRLKEDILTTMKSLTKGDMTHIQKKGENETLLSETGATLPTVNEFQRMVKNDPVLQQLQEAIHTRTVGCVLFPRYCKSPFKVKDAASLNIARQMLGLMARELGIE